ncbi:MAG: hypothetical protein DRN25_03620 [Thermoplasmata archaeon]|nr:MAG: hypothetical protein DRN25_03620 [Thermoplasmata archaeon]
MATRGDIVKNLEIIKERLQNPALKERFSNFTKNLQFNFPDMNTSYIVRIENGEVKSISEGELENPDIQVTADSDVLIDILNKKLNPMKAYTMGKLKAKGKLTDLLKLQKLM